MAAFASDRRSGWVRVLVLILCALFIFATIATPPAYAVGETVALFGLAAVLSAATAALGFKLANNAEGQATLQKMVQDFAGASIAAGLVLTGSKLNGLVNGMQYIKMAVHNGKTYLDERIFAWCQQWLAVNGVYDVSSVSFPSYSVGSSLSFQNTSLSSVLSALSSYVDISYLNDLISYFNIDFSGKAFVLATSGDSSLSSIQVCDSSLLKSSYKIQYEASTSSYYVYINDGIPSTEYSLINGVYGSHLISFSTPPITVRHYVSSTQSFYQLSNYGDMSIIGNDTGLSGTDTLGKDVIDLTLDQILEKLKEWAQDWYDAGADSVTNAATGAKDLPLSVATGAATANPALNPDDVYNPPFAIPLPGLRSGETDTNTVEQGKENASSAETSTVDVAENQTVINSLVSWALNYIDPDTGLFSKFPLCVPYDAYLLVTSSLGVDAVGSDSIFGASPGDLDGVVTESIDTYSDFQPIININNDFELDGKIYPISITIDLTPWQPLVTFFREGMALLLVAELIGSEYKRIRGH